MRPSWIVLVARMSADLPGCTTANKDGEKRLVLTGASAIAPCPF